MPPKGSGTSRPPSAGGASAGKKPSSKSGKSSGKRKRSDDESSEASVDVTYIGTVAPTHVYVVVSYESFCFYSGWKGGPGIEDYVDTKNHSVLGTFRNLKGAVNRATDFANEHVNGGDGCDSAEDEEEARTLLRARMSWQDHDPDSGWLDDIEDSVHHVVIERHLLR